jgi:hypothetical protein
LNDRQRFNGILWKTSKKEENIMGGFDRAVALNKMKWKPN